MSDESPKADNSQVGLSGIDDPFGYWLSGLADGEGCFRIARSGKRLHPRFGLLFRADDRALVEMVQQKFNGIGGIHEGKGYSGHNPMVQWEVFDKLGLQVIVEFFGRFPLRSKKAKDFVLWRDAVEAYAKKPSDQLVIRKVQRMLCIQRAYGFDELESAQDHLGGFQGNE
jgi:hypothetical protein